MLRDVEGLQSAMELAESARRQYNESAIAALAAVPSLAGSPCVVEDPAKHVFEPQFAQCGAWCLRNHWLPAGVIARVLLHCRGLPPFKCCLL